MSKLMKLQILKTILSLSVLIPYSTTLALDPRSDLKKISSENFDIIYDAKSYELAKTYLEEAERSHKILKDVFGIAPDKTTVVLDDTLDLANGGATGVPRPHIIIYVSQPDPLSSIDHSSYWPRDVFLHEYAHILNMEPANGAWKPLRYIFGSFIRPNMYLPRWYLEGLAVEMESRFNEFGRLKSSDYDGLIRSLYLDSKWGTDNLSAINEISNPYWPAGQRPYFYGALLWHEIIQSQNLGVVQRFNDHYSRRFPWFISHPMVREMGQNYQQLLAKVYKKYGEIADQQINKIKTQPTTLGKITQEDEKISEHTISLSPNKERFAAVATTVDGDMLISIFKKENEAWVLDKDLTKLTSARGFFERKKYALTRASWFPSGDKIVYDAADIHDRVHFFYDLYTYDFKEKKRKQLTEGLRAREPAVSPDGQTILFVKIGGGKTELYTITSEGKNPQLIYTPPPHGRVSTPSFLNERQIIFAQKDRTGIDKLHVFDLESKQVTRVLDMQAKFPSVTENGIVFASNKNGVENLYLTSLDFSNVKPLTNSLSRVLNGTLAGDTLIYSELTGIGPKIKTSNLDNTLKILPTVEHPIKNNFPKTITEAEPVTSTEKNYSALPYMFPQYWVPYVGAVDGGTVASIALPGSDPTGFHYYLLQASYDSRPRKYSGYFAYLWQNSLGQTYLSAMDYHRYYVSTEDTTNSQLASLIHGFYIPGLNHRWTALLGYEYKRTSILENPGPEKRNHYFKGPSVGISYKEMDQKNLSISPAGLAAKVKYTEYESNTTKTNYNETFTKLSYYHSKWLPSRHVLAFQAQGVHSEANRNILLGTTSTDVELGYALGSDNENFITRGYPSGEFIGYSIAAGSLEYRFPIYDMWKGPNSPAPYYIKRFHGAVFAETLTLRGLFYDENDTARNTDFGKYYTTAGLELKIDTTLLYHAPVTIKITGAYGFEKEANGGFTGNVFLVAPELF